MSKFKLLMISAGLAFLANNLGILLLMAGIPWLIYPAICLAPQFDSALKKVVVLYLIGFFQFGALFFVFLWAVSRSRGKKAT